MMITIVRFICNKINYIVALFAIGLSISPIQAQNKKDEKKPTYIQSRYCS